MARGPHSVVPTARWCEAHSVRSDAGRANAQPRVDAGGAAGAPAAAAAGAQPARGGAAAYEHVFPVEFEAGHRLQIGPGGMYVRM